MLALRAENASEWTGPTGNSTYLFPGPPSILIDAGVGHAAHVTAIERALSGLRLDLLLITHAHPLALIDEYLAHRAMRERQVLEAVKANCETVDEIVARIYPDLSASLIDAATETVRSHLEKLREDGVILRP